MSSRGDPRSCPETQLIAVAASVMSSPGSTSASRWRTLTFQPLRTFGANHLQGFGAGDQRPVSGDLSQRANGWFGQERADRQQPAGAIGERPHRFVGEPDRQKVAVRERTRGDEPEQRSGCLRVD